MSIFHHYDHFIPVGGYQSLASVQLRLKNIALTHDRLSTMSERNALLSNKDFTGGQDTESRDHVSCDDDRRKPLNGHPHSVNASTNQSGFKHASSLSTVKKLIVGLIIVVLIAVTWVAHTQTAKSTFRGDFAAPFFLVWFGTCSMIFVFPLTAPIYFITGQGKCETQGIKDLWK